MRLLDVGRELIGSIGNRLVPSYNLDSSIVSRFAINMSSKTGVQSIFKRSICAQCRNNIIRKNAPRSFTTASRLAAEERQTQRQAPGLRPLAPGRRSSGLRAVTQQLQATNAVASFPNTTITTAEQTNTTASDADNVAAYLSNISLQVQNSNYLSPNSIATPEPHHLHIFSHKHNIHITLTNPAKEPIISLSAGNIGFKHTQRGSFDAGYQLAAYVMRSIQEKGLLRKPTRMGPGGRKVADDASMPGMPQPIRKLEIVMRGFGQGREAAMKVILGNEGRNIRGLVTRVSDSTRLKFGGTRSKGPRRL